MPVFEVSITRLISTGDVKTKYLMKLHREFPQVGQSAFTGFSDDAALCEALARLGLPEPQQQRMLSALHRGGDNEVFTTDISNEVARSFGWWGEE